MTRQLGIGDDGVKDGGKEASDPLAQRVIELDVKLEVELGLERQDKVVVKRFH